MRPRLTIRQFAASIIGAICLSAVVVLIERSDQLQLFQAQELSQQQSARLRNLLQSSTLKPSMRVELRGCRIHFIDEDPGACKMGEDSRLRREHIINLSNVEVPAQSALLNDTRTGHAKSVSYFNFPHTPEYQQIHSKKAADGERLLQEYRAELGRGRRAANAKSERLLDIYGEEARDNAEVFTYCDGQISIFIKQTEVQRVFLSSDHTKELLTLLRRYKGDYCASGDAQ